MRVLLVKTSSLGDLVHTFPAITDASRALPGLQLDWLVEESFAEVPAWHPAIDQVIPIALRRWRRDWRKAYRSGQIAGFRSRLRERGYDLVIDTQGLLKSALPARWARGPVVGYDRRSAREPLAALFYQRRITVSRGQRAIERTRQLFAEALGYPRPSASGLAHLAAAVEVPCVVVYGPTDASLTGVRGSNAEAHGNSVDCAPCLDRTCRFLGQYDVEPMCFDELSTGRVWGLLTQAMAERRSRGPGAAGRA